MQQARMEAAPGDVLPSEQSTHTRRLEFLPTVLTFRLHA